MSLFCVNGLRWKNENWNLEFFPKGLHLEAGNIILQDGKVFVLDEDTYAKLLRFEIEGKNLKMPDKDMFFVSIKTLKHVLVPSVIYEETNENDLYKLGPSHTVTHRRLLNADGTLIYEEWEATCAHNEGCSRSHWGVVRGEYKDPPSA